MPRLNQGVTNEQISLLTKSIILMSLRRQSELLGRGMPSLSTHYMDDACNWGASWKMLGAKLLWEAISSLLSSEKPKRVREILCVKSRSSADCWLCVMWFLTWICAENNTTTVIKVWYTTWREMWSTRKLLDRPCRCKALKLAPISLDWNSPSERSCYRLAARQSP
jgi:hypothetical protein